MRPLYYFASIMRETKVIRNRYEAYRGDDMNRSDFLEALSKSRELEIAFKGRKTNRTFKATVWFVQEDERIYLLPVYGSDTNWYKNILANPNLEIAAEGKNVKVKAKSLTEKKQVSDVIDRFDEKFGADEIKKWYSKLDVAVELALS